jgi:hypothetical protein
MMLMILIEVMPMIMSEDERRNRKRTNDRMFSLDQDGLTKLNEQVEEEGK